MPRQIRIEFPGALYYVTIQAYPGGSIFRDRIDKQRFYQIIDYAIRRYTLKLHAFALFEDEYHILIETPLGNLTKSIQYINSHFIAYSNTRWGNSGRVFHGRYKSIVIKKDTYLLKIADYIHALPDIKGIFPAVEFQWSSYGQYAAISAPPPHVTTKDLLYHLNTVAPGATYASHFAALSLDSHTPVADSLKTLTILGSDDYRAHIDAIDQCVSCDTLSPTEIIAEVAGWFNVHEDMIIDNRIKPNNPRNIAIYLCRNMTPTPLETLGEMFNVGPSSICNTTKRVEASRKMEPPLDMTIQDVEKNIRIKKALEHNHLPREHETENN